MTSQLQRNEADFVLIPRTFFTLLKVLFRNPILGTQRYLSSRHGEFRFRHGSKLWPLFWHRRFACAQMMPMQLQLWHRLSAYGLRRSIVLRGLLRKANIPKDVVSLIFRMFWLRYVPIDNSKPPAFYFYPTNTADDMIVLRLSRDLFVEPYIELLLSSGKGIASEAPF